MHIYVTNNFAQNPEDTLAWNNSAISKISVSDKSVYDEWRVTDQDIIDQFEAQYKAALYAECESYIYENYSQKKQNQDTLAISAYNTQLLAAGYDLSADIALAAVSILNGSAVYSDLLEAVNLKYELEETSYVEIAGKLLRATTRSGWVRAIVAQAHAAYADSSTPEYKEYMVF